MPPAETPTECEQYYERAPGYGNLLPSKKHDADLHARIRELVDLILNATDLQSLQEQVALARSEGGGA